MKLGPGFTNNKILMFFALTNCRKIKKMITLVTVMEIVAVAIMLPLRDNNANVSASVTLFVDELTWNEANQYCRSIGQHLVKIGRQAKEHYLHEHLVSLNIEKLQDKIFYYEKFFCCDNHEDHGGHCKPCPIGFTSAAGKRCVPCSRNTFGMKCAEYCQCKLGQRCDKAVGCIQVEHTTVVTTNYTANESEYFEKNTIQTTSSYQRKPTRTFINHFVEESDEKDHTGSLNVTQTYITTEITGHIDTIIFTVVSISFLLFLSICVLVIYCIRNKLHPQKIFHIMQNNSTGQQDNSGHRSLPNNEIEDDVNAYAEIDEQRMCPDSPSSRTDQISSESKSSSSSKESKESVNEGYLNPYQALLTDSKMKKSSGETFDQEDKEEQQRKYSKLENNVQSEKTKNTNGNPAKVIYLELEDINNVKIKPAVESENGYTKDDNTALHVEWTFKRLNTM